MQCRAARFVCCGLREIYFDAPDELAPESELPVLPAALPEPRLPEPVEPVLPAPDVLLGALDEPADDEPDAWSRRQRSFSEPVRLSHCVLLPTLGELALEEPVALGEELEPVAPLVEDEESLPVALGLLPTL